MQTHEEQLKLAIKNYEVARAHFHGTELVAERCEDNYRGSLEQSMRFADLDSRIAIAKLDQVKSGSPHGTSLPMELQLEVQHRNALRETLQSDKSAWELAKVECEEARGIMQTHIRARDDEVLCVAAKHVSNLTSLMETLEQRAGALRQLVGAFTQLGLTMTTNTRPSKHTSHIHAVVIRPPRNENVPRNLGYITELRGYIERLKTDPDTPPPSEPPLVLEKPFYTKTLGELMGIKG